MLMIRSREERLERLGEKLPPSMRRELLELPKAKIVDETYVSRFRISADLVTVAGGVHSIRFPAQTVRTFRYGIGESMAPAGFPAAAPYLVATRSDTNLLRGGVTNNSEVLGIEAVALNFGSRNDGELFEQLLPNVSCAFSIGGAERNKHIGSPYLLTSTGGVWGQQESFIKTPPALESRSVHPGQQTIGMPHEAGGYDLGETIAWGPGGVQGIDHIFSLDFELTREIIVTGIARAADATLGIPAFTPPVAQVGISDTRGTFIDGYALLRGLAVRGNTQY